MSPSVGFDLSFRRVWKRGNRAWRDTEMCSQGVVDDVEVGKTRGR
jgi:hypothetical protein